MLAMREWRVGLGRRPASHSVGLLYSLSRAESWDRLSNRGIAPKNREWHGSRAERVNVPDSE